MALSLGASACGSDNSSGGGGDTSGGGGGSGGLSEDLQLGALIPQTGDLSQFAPAGEKAANLAVEELNSALKESGSSGSVSLEVGDTETKPQAGQQAAQQLISDGASCLAGAWGSAITIPVGSSVAARQQVPLISPASTSPEITDLPDEGFVFRTAPSDALQGQVLSDAVAEQFGKDATISLAARNDAYGEGIITQFQQAFEDGGGTTTGPVLYDPEATSYDSEAGQITQGNPDGYVIIDFEDPYSKVGAALARSGNFDPTNLYTADGLAFDKIPGSIPDAALAGAHGTRPATPEGTDTAQAFADLYKQSDMKPSTRNTFDAQNFDAVMLCALASVAAGSTDGADIQSEIQNVSGPPGTQYDYTQLSDAITALGNGEDIDYQGVSGPIDFDENGDPSVAFYEVWQYDDQNKLEVLRQVERNAEEGG